MAVTNESALYIGVDIGGTRMKSGLVEIESGEVLESIVQPTETTSPAVFLQQIAEVINAFQKRAAADNRFIEGIGFGIPGFTGSNGDVVTTYDFLPFMENYPLGKIISDNFQLPCLMDNDARNIALGEALYGAGKNYNRVLTLTLGTGLGFGLVVNGSFTDAMPLAHMGGHMSIAATGERCYCGKMGCLESMVSAGAFVNAAKMYSNIDVSVPAIFAAAEKGNKDALQIIHGIAGHLHTGIHNYVNLFAPEIIVLGGGIAKSLEPFLSLIKGDGYAAAFPGYQFKLVVSRMQELAGMAGSAALFKQKNAAHENCTA